MIEPIGDAQRRQVLERTEFFIASAEQLFERRFERIPVHFDLRGSTAGMFKLHGKHCQIRYNPWIFAKYFAENLHETVPHEVAHYIVHKLYVARRVKPHGVEWRRVMAAFGIDPAVTFDLCLDGVPQRRQRTHRYHCGCRVHELSSTRHNRVQRRRGQYQCQVCGGLLVYSPQPELSAER